MTRNGGSSFDWLVRARGLLAGDSAAARSLRILVVLLVALLGLEFWTLSTVTSPSVSGRQLSYSGLLQDADRSLLLSAVFLQEDQYVQGRLCSTAAQNGVCKGSAQAYYTALDRTSGSLALHDALAAKGVAVSNDPQSFKSALRFLMTFLLPLLILVVGFGIIFVSRTGQSSISDVIGFGRVRKRSGERVSTGVTFRDVAGADEAVAELAEVRDYLRAPDRYSEMGALPPKGVLLLGPPGCGKTLLARAVAGESEVPFFSMSGAEFVESLVGVGAARVRDLFRQAQENAPAIIFIDELDAAARRRNVGGGSGGADEREQTLNQMLVAMDGFEISSGIVVIGATNRPDILDPALMRPGRFDRHITVDEPDVNGRRAILELHAGRRRLAGDVDFDLLAHRTPGFTGADLNNVVNEAALLAVRGSRDEVSMAHLLEAVQRVIAGPQRSGHLMSEEERQRLAYHESGHAVVAAALGMAAKVHRVSIVARGRGLAQAQVGQRSDRVLFTRRELLDEMTMAMGGSAAEELLFHDASTAAENDIERVTELARQVVGRYGMSEELGPVRYMGKDVDIYLGGESDALVTMAPVTLQEFDREVRNIAEYARQRAGELCAKHRDGLDAMAERLLDIETIEGPPLDSLLKLVPGPVGAGAQTARGAAGNGAGSTRATARRRGPSRAGT